MRHSAYINALEEAAKLPKEIPELIRRFRDFYSPKQQAFEHIKRKACSDVLLHISEIAEVLNWKEDNAQDTDDSATKQAQASEEDRECSGSDQ